ncbi:enoyl-CoA hydratase/isomerase family protein [Zavarzinia sp.]|uniref:enoyl-CoA hydratase/isomerase family protein n=1 Tax=Zavarzinia sp. TaxID=2027920 RepID=UPI003562E3B0
MSQVTVTIADGIALVTLNAPPHGQFERSTIDALGAAIDTVETQASVKAVVVTGGIPGVFADHYSIREFEAVGRHLKGHKPAADEDPLPAATAFAAHLARIEASPRPWIAAINGTCIGAGFELALACDIRVVEDDGYSIGLPEANLGLLPVGGGTQRLPRLIGPAKALQLILMGLVVSPVQALQLGIAQEMAPDLAVDAAMVMARRLADQFAPASAAVKRLVRAAATTPLAEGLAAERAAFLDLVGQAEPLARMHDLNRGERDICD